MDDIVITRDRDDVEMEDDEIDRLKKSASKRKGRGMMFKQTLVSNINFEWYSQFEEIIDSRACH